METVSPAALLAVQAGSREAINNMSRQREEAGFAPSAISERGSIASQSARFFRQLDDFEPIGMTISQFCKYVGLGRTSIYELRKAGKLRIVKIAGRSIVPTDEGRRLIAEAIAAAQ